MAEAVDARAEDEDLGSVKDFILNALQQSTDQGGQDVSFIISQVVYAFLMWETVLTACLTSLRHTAPET